METGNMTTVANVTRARSVPSGGATRNISVAEAKAKLSELLAGVQYRRERVGLRVEHWLEG